MTSLTGQGEGIQLLVLEQDLTKQPWEHGTSTLRQVHLAQMVMLLCKHECTIIIF